MPISKIYGLQNTQVQQKNHVKNNQSQNYQPTGVEYINMNANMNNISPVQVMGNIINKAFQNIASSVNKATGNNKTDNNADNQSKTTINGMEISEGETIQLDNGATATLQSGTLTISTADGKTTSQNVSSGDSIEVDCSNGNINITSDNSNNNCNTLNTINNSNQTRTNQTNNRLNLIA